MVCLHIQVSKMATTMSGGNSESENIAKALKIVKETLAVNTEFVSLIRENGSLNLSVGTIQLSIIVILKV